MFDSPYEHGSGAEVPKRECPHGMRLCAVREKGGGIVARRAERRGMRAVSGFERMKRANGRSGLAKRKKVSTGSNRSVNGGAKRENAAASRKYARKTLCATSERRKASGKG